MGEHGGGCNPSGDYCGFLWSRVAEVCGFCILFTMLDTSLISILGDCSSLEMSSYTVWLLVCVCVSLVVAMSLEGMGSSSFVLCVFARSLLAFSIVSSRALHKL
jgi:hypothetical protein